MLRQNARKAARAAGLPLAVLGCLLAMAGPARAQLLQERLALIPPKVNLGEGTVRLDGMGGFLITVPDENNEINLHDFSANPAGFSDDKDSWSIDLRYSHDEYLEQSALTQKNDINSNDGAFLLGYHHPGRLGVGGQINYSEALTRDVTKTRQDFRVTGFVLTANKYLFPRLTVGARVARSGEDQNTLSNSIYKISHTDHQLTGDLGAGLRVARGVMVGVRGQVGKGTLDGESRSSVHTDEFTWNRPSDLWSVHGFVDRGRVEAGVDYSHHHLEGDEAVDISWSQRFLFNPTNEAYTAHTETFSEDRTDKLFRARVRLNVVPGRFSVSGAVSSAKGDARVDVNPNAIGSLEPGRWETSGKTAVGGATWVGMQGRLLLAGEVEFENSDLDNLVTEPLYKSTRDALTGRGGCEYLLGESFIGRVGFSHTRESLKRDETNPETGLRSRVVDTTVGSSVLSAGLGVVPRGAIFQLDLAYQVIVNSDLGTDYTRFAAGVRYLF